MRFSSSSFVRAWKGLVTLLPILLLLTTAGGLGNIFDISTVPLVIALLGAALLIDWVKMPHRWQKTGDLLRVHRTIFVPQLVLTILAVISVIGRPLSFEMVKHLSIMCAALVAVASVLWLRTAWSNMARIQSGIIVCLLIQGIVGLGQFMRQRDLGLYWLDEQVAQAAQGFNVLFVNGVRVLRAQGLNWHPNPLAAFLLTGCLILLIPTQQQRRRHLLWLALLVALPAAFVTFSRSAWLGYGVGLGFLTLVGQLWPRRQWRGRLWLGVTLSVATVGIGVMLLGNIVASRVQPADNPLEERSINERVSQYRVAQEVISAQPVRGVGAGNLKQYLSEVYAADASVRSDSLIHNIPLLISAEIGIVGGILWLWLMVYPPLAVLLKRQTVSLEAIGLASVLSVLLVTNLLTIFSWWNADGLLYHWLLLGLFSAELNRPPRHQASSPSRAHNGTERE